MSKFKKADYIKILDSHNDSIVKMRNVDLWFGKKGIGVHAINNLSLNLRKNEILGLVGESGSGKSTTGNAIIGLVDRQEGDIIINSEFNVPKSAKKIKKKDNDYLVNNVQMILQDPTESLNPYKNIFKVVTEGLVNVDIKKNFLKTFDGRTIIGLKKIVQNSSQKQPKSIEKLSIKYLNELVENEKTLELKETLYTNVINDVKESKRLIDRQIYTLLTQRAGERERYIKNGVIKKRKAIKKIATDMVESIGLSRNTFERFPLEFSGGQQQRVGIARAVALRPKILIADEPISALDVSIQAQVVNIIKDLKEDFNLSILFIAHDLMMVEYISDRIAVMYKGQLLEVGSSKGIMKNPIHPYTKSLLDSVPSINNISMIKATRYHSSIHKYNATNKPEWFSIEGDTEHLVFGSRRELKLWTGGKYE